jgi:hypothetical protein
MLLNRRLRAPLRGAMGHGSRRERGCQQRWRSGTTGDQERKPTETHVVEECGGVLAGEVVEVEVGRLPSAGGRSLERRFCKRLSTAVS